MLPWWFIMAILIVQTTQIWKLCIICKKKIVLVKISLLKCKVLWLAAKLVTYSKLKNFNSFSKTNRKAQNFHISNLTYLAYHNCHINRCHGNTNTNGQECGWVHMYVGMVLLICPPTSNVKLACLSSVGEDEVIKSTCWAVCQSGDRFVPPVTLVHRHNFHSHPAASSKLGPGFIHWGLSINVSACCPPIRLLMEVKYMLHLQR